MDDRPRGRDVYPKVQPPLGVPARSFRVELVTRTRVIWFGLTVEAALDGGGGFERFVADRSGSLLRTAWVLTGDWAQAEDRVQNALVIAWQHWESLERKDAPEVYVCRVLVNTSQRWRRRHWVGEVPTADLPERPIADHTGELVQREADAVVAAATRGPSRPPSSTPSRMRRPVPAMIAAVVVVVAVVAVAVLAIVLIHAGQAGPKNAAVGASSSTAPSASQSVHRSSPAATGPVPEPRLGVALKRWKSNVVASGEFSTQTLLASGGSLYALGTTQVERLSPTSGAVTARSVFRGMPGKLARVGEQIWLPVIFRGALSVQRYTTALSPLSSVTVTTGEPDGLAPAAAARQVGSIFYVTDGTHLFGVDTRTATAQQVPYSPGGSIAALAASRGSSGDLISTVQLAAGGKVDTLHPAGPGPAMSVERSVTFPYAGRPSSAPGSLATTEAGVWVTVSIGNESSLDFVTAGSKIETAESDVPNGSSITVTSQATWLGQLGALTCLDSTTGRALASSHVDGPESSIGAVAASNGHLYGVWLASGATWVVQFVPPARCES